MSMYKTFKTKRLIIRPTSEKDAELFFQLLNTPKFIKFVGDREIDKIQDAKKYIQNKILAQLHTLGYSSYSIITKADGLKVGSCGLYNREGLDGIDIGFSLYRNMKDLGLHMRQQKEY